MWVPAFAGTTSLDSFEFPRTALRESGDPSLRATDRRGISRWLEQSAPPPCFAQDGRVG